MKDNYFLKCIGCGKTAEGNRTDFCCDECGDIFDVKYKNKFNAKKEDFENIKLNESGVWRYKKMLPNLKKIISRNEGNTRMYFSEVLNKKIGFKDFYIKHEGENPTLSFKDRGMTVAISHGVSLGYDKFICASTGNTSASLASYTSHAEKDGIILVPDKNIAMGKLSQALALGAKVFQVSGNFDKAMSMVIENANELGLYILNSINPFRIEGQKTIAWEIMQNLNWEMPDWIILPAGNLGNTTAIGKAINEAFDCGLINKKPRIASIQAKGSNPFFKSFKNNFESLKNEKNPQTIASAIKIGAPISWKKAKNAILSCEGVVEEVSDEEIMNAKAIIDSAGIGCEPASACSVAGSIKLKEKGIMLPNEKIVAILTGNLLKDSDSTMDYHLGRLDYDTRYKNAPIKIESKLKDIL